MFIHNLKCKNYKSISSFLLVFSTFQKNELESGFEIMTVKTRSRTKLEVVHTGPCCARDLKLMSCQRLYIRPIQQDISLDEQRPPSSSATLECCYCAEQVPSAEMRDHVEQCKNSVNIHVNRELITHLEIQRK